MASVFSLAHNYKAAFGYNLFLELLEPLVSLGAARRDYKVVIDPDTLRIDQEATDCLRRDSEVTSRGMLDGQEGD